MVHRRSRWREGALAIASVVVLAGPIALVWHWLRPEPWDARHLRVQFESVRYERAGLVFTYRLENRTRRSARLLPDRTTIRVMQPGDEPVLGYPVVRLPLDIEAHESPRVEVRLELATPRETMLTPRQSEEQTARVLRHKLPDASDLDSPLSPLPMPEAQAAPSAPPSASPAALFAEVLTALNGFELEDASHGIRIVFPRGW
jgi:hypothetical protein